MTINSTSEVNNNLSISLSTEEIASEFSGDVYGSVAAMILLQAKENRDMARTAKIAEENNLLAEENEQVEKMHDKADEVRAAGSWEGWTTIGAGLLEMGSGVVTMTGSTSEAGDLLPKAKGEAALMSSGGTVFQGIGKLEGAEHNGAATDDEADATLASNRADFIKRKLEDIKDLEKDANDLGRDAIDFYRNIVSTKGETDRSAIFLRG